MIIVMLRFQNSVRSQERQRHDIRPCHGRAITIFGVSFRVYRWMEGGLTDHFQSAGMVVLSREDTPLIRSCWAALFLPASKESYSIRKPKLRESIARSRSSSAHLVRPMKLFFA